MKLKDIMSRMKNGIEKYRSRRAEKNRLEECSKLEDADGEVFVWIDTPLSPDDPKINVLSN